MKSTHVNCVINQFSLHKTQEVNEHFFFIYTVLTLMVLTTRLSFLYTFFFLHTNHHENIIHVHGSVQCNMCTYVQWKCVYFCNRKYQSGSFFFILLKPSNQLNFFFHVDLYTWDTNKIIFVCQCLNEKKKI